MDREKTQERWVEKEREGEGEWGERARKREMVRESE